VPAVDLVRADLGGSARLRALVVPGVDGCAVLLFCVFFWRVLFDTDDSLFDVLAVVTGVFGAGAALLARRSIRTFIDGPFCAYIGACLVSTAVNHGRYVPMIADVPIASWRPALHAIALLTYFYGVSSLLRTDRQVGTMLAVIVVVVSLFGARVTYDHVQAGLGGRPWSYAVVGQWGGGGYPEIGTLLVLAVPVPIAAVAVSRSVAVSSASALVALALILHVALLYYRGAYIAVAVTIVALAVLEWIRLRGWRLASGAAVVVVLLLLSPTGLSRWVGELWTGSFYYLDTQGSVESRVEIWRHTLALIRDHPVVGVGPGNYTDALRHGYVTQPRREDAQAHSLLLRAAAETGVVGLLPFLLLWWRMLKCSAVRVARSHIGMLAMGLFGSYVGFLALNADMVLGGLPSSDRMAFLLWTFFAATAALQRAGQMRSAEA
jgi:O-antigen ligase